MADKQKVIDGLKCHLDCRCNECPYKGKYIAQCVTHLIKDMLSLLEEEPKPQRYREDDIFHIPMCPNERCNAKIYNRFAHYCPYCGTRYQWSDELEERMLENG